MPDATSYRLAALLVAAHLPLFAFALWESRKKARPVPASVKVMLVLFPAGVVRSLGFIVPMPPSGRVALDVPYSVLMIAFLWCLYRERRGGGLPPLRPLTGSNTDDKQR